MTLTCDFDLQSPASYGHDLFPHAKIQGQRSVGSVEWKETDGHTDGRTEAITLPAAIIRSAINHSAIALITEVLIFCSVTRLPYRHSIQVPSHNYTDMTFTYCYDAKNTLVAEPVKPLVITLPAPRAESVKHRCGVYLSICPSLPFFLTLVRLLGPLLRETHQRAAPAANAAGVSSGPCIRGSICLL